MNIAELNIGSRPASGKQTRPIPWVSSWSQCRLMLPGWYGFGSAVAAFREKHGDSALPLLRRMVREWSFFASLLSNMGMVLGKSDLTIAERYAQLVKDEDLRESIFERLKTEWLASVAALLDITDQNELLDGIAAGLRNSG